MEAASSTGSAPAPRRPSCEHCGKVRAVLAEMVPGRDGKSWWLCPTCWDRTPAMSFQQHQAPVPIVSDPKIIDGLKKSGWKVTPLDDAPKRKGKKR